MILTVTLNTSVDKLYVIDRLCPHEVMRVKEVNNTAGGKGLNVSRVAAISGERVAAMGFVGGHNGALFESLIPNDGIEKQFTHVQAETRCCVNVRDLKTNRSTEFLEPGNPVTTEEVQRFLSDYEALLPKASVVTISGSMPRGVPLDFYGTLVTAARRHRKQVLLDTSGESLRNALASGPAMIKPNADEIRQLLHTEIGSREDLIAAIKCLHQSGIGAVAVSLGKDGVFVACKEGVFQGITPDIPVVNTVGCGDSMVAGFAVSMVRRQSIEEAIRYAVAVSTANALTKETGYYHPKDLAELLPQVRVERLESSGQ